MTEILERIERVGVLPVAVLDAADEALFLADVLRRAGIPLLEVAFRTEAAADAIRYVREGCPDIAVGAGTVLTPAQAEQAVRAGAQFIVSPGLDGELAAWCRSAGTPLIPGVATPSEVMAALREGMSILKFFPAEAMGGAKALQALAPVFPQIRFIPTGGIHPGNLAEYLKLPNVIACAGTWLADRWLIQGRRSEELTRLAQEARAIAQEARRKADPIPDE